RINSHFLEKIILQEIEKAHDNPNLYSLLGNIYFESKNWTGVQDAWEKSLALEPDNALVLNNLAWHYATCEDEHFQNPVRALALAKLAIQLEKSPHIWDTLAESYYVNGMYQEAVEAGRKALALAGRKRIYYEEQLKKFSRAAGH
ncbi:MAG: tetratricopeptide repeat protein, partial [Desulfobulbia bacterium]